MTQYAVLYLRDGWIGRYNQQSWYDNVRVYAVDQTTPVPTTNTYVPYPPDGPVQFNGTIIGDGPPVPRAMGTGTQQSRDAAMTSCTPVLGIWRREAFGLYATGTG